MALLTYNGTNYDTMLGSAAIASGTVNLTLAGITSAGVTAPNLVNAVNGCWINVASLPTNGGNLTVEVMESGVSKALATINNADIKLGFNYVRFATPYVFGTLTASAFTARVKNTVGTSGSLRLATSGLWFEFTYNLTAASPTTSDDVWVGGFNDAGLTPKNLVITGSGNSWGTGAGTSPGSTTQFMGAALTIGSGGTTSRDQTASNALTLKGSVYVTAGGVWDNRAPSNKAIIVTTSFDMVATGDQGFFTATGNYGGQILTTGATYVVSGTYASGVGTAASPLTYQAAHGLSVGDEIVVAGNGYLNNQTRFVITVVNSTQVVVSNTSGGSENAITNTPTVGAHIGNLTRNSIIKVTNTARGYYAVNASNTAGDFSYTRFEYSECNSGKAMNLQLNSLTPMDGIVLYNNPSSGRHNLVLPGNALAQTFTGLILYNTRGGNYSGQSGIGFSASSNKAFIDCLHFNGPSSTETCAFISLNLSSTANIFTNCHSYGANAGNSSAGYAIGLFSSSGNIFNNCSVNGARQNAVYSNTGDKNTFNNCNFGDKATNTIDIFVATESLNTMLFNACVFSSATLISNYLNQLEGSLIAFQDMDLNTSKHRWYTNHGKFRSSGSGLADTTVRTAGSLALASEPEDATLGSSYIFRVPASPSSKVVVPGYIYRNATFSSGVIKAELFLPGNVSTTPDATYTFPTTTLQWLDFTLAAQYNGTVPRYAIVKITGFTATSGAIFFVDDLYDAGLNNKVAGFDLWDEGQPSKIMVVTDFSAAVPVIVNSLWNDSNTYAVGTKGKAVIDTESNSDATQAKVDVL